MLARARGVAPYGGDGQTIGTNLVRKEDVAKELKEIRDVKKLLDRLKDAVRPADVFAAVSTDAAKMIAVEAMDAPSSSERIRAAQDILNRHDGKPVDRLVTININPSDLSDEELDFKIKETLHELGITGKEGDSPQKLVIEKRGHGPDEAKEVLSE